MVRQLRTFALGLMVVAALGLASTAAAGPTIPARIRGVGEVTLLVPPTPENPVARQEYVTRGVSTLLGRFTSRGVTLISTDGKVRGRLVGVAADASTIAASYSGTIAPIPGTPNFRVEAVLVIEGGTGRLTGLGGRADFVVIGGLVGPFEFQGNGTYTLP